jgi:hypothetical protein
MLPSNGLAIVRVGFRLMVPSFLWLMLLAEVVVMLAVPSMTPPAIAFCGS